MSPGRDPRWDGDDEPRPEGGVGSDDEVEILGIEAVDEAELEAEADRLAGRSPEPAPAPAVERAAPAGGDELAQLKDRHLRLLADFDNFRKRAEREREERARYSLAEPLRDLLPVVDNLERALAARGSLDDLRLGVEMISRQFEEVLRRFGVTAVASVGQRFDPRVHEAVSRVESPGVEAPTVIDEMQRGYRLHDRVLRPAMVRVAVPIEQGGEPAEVPAERAPDSGSGEGA
jgi:molecular chaperone GrpE